MEGGTLTHAVRVVRGEPIYAPPSVDFVAFFYTPLYPRLLALLSHVTGGLSFTLGRADRFVSAALYVAVSVAGGLLAACAGYMLAKRVA